MACLGLGQQQAARGSVLEALRLDPALELAPDECPARMVRFFEEVRESEGLTRPAAVPDHVDPGLPEGPGGHRDRPARLAIRH